MTPGLRHPPGRTGSGFLHQHAVVIDLGQHDDAALPHLGQGRQPLTVTLVRGERRSLPAPAPAKPSGPHVQGVTPVIPKNLIGWAGTYTRKSVAFFGARMHPDGMMRRFRTFLTGLALLCMLLASVMASGASHRGPSADSLALDAFVLAGGTLADICDDSGRGHSDGLTGCLACHIVGTADVPAPSPVPRAAGLIVTAAVTAPQESRAVRQAFDFAHAMRAPPLA